MIKFGKFLTNVKDKCNKAIAPWMPPRAVDRYITSMPCTQKSAKFVDKELSQINNDECECRGTVHKV